MPGTGQKIWLIDDSELTQEMMSVVLEAYGYELLCSSQPDAAPPGDGISLVLLDVSIPGVAREDLGKHVERLRHDLSGAPVVLHSSHDAQTLEAIVAASGADGFLQKTGDDDALVAALDRWLNAA